MAEQRFESILERSKNAVASYQAPFTMDAMCGKGFPPGFGTICIISCSDARVEPTDFLKLRKGEAIIIRNAGGRVDDGVFRSMSVMGTIAPIGLIAVIHHTDCGGVYTTDEEVGSKLAARNSQCAHELPTTFGTFRDIGLDESIRQDLARIKAWRFLAPTTTVKGYALTLETGEIREVDGSTSPANMPARKVVKHASL